MAARSQGHVASVVHLGTTLAEVHGMVAEVVWTDRAPERAEPKSFILFQDAALDGEGVVSIPPEQTGPFLGAAYAGLTNEGDLIPYASGTWDEDVGVARPTPSDLSLQVLRTGSLWDSAEWGFKYDADPADDWRGMDDLRWLHDAHTPFGPGAVLGSCYATVHSRAFNRVVAGYHPTSSTDLMWVWRSAGAADPKAWSAPITMTFSPFRGPALSSGYSTMWELPDGALRWAYSYVPDNTLAPSKYDIDILGSTDGGLTWTVVKEQVLTELFGQPHAIENFKVAVAGSWQRMEIWSTEVTTPGLVSAVSTDRAATWKLITTDGDGTDDTGGNSDASDKWETWDLCAVDSSGSFMRVRTINTSSDLNFQLASRDGAWTTISSTLSALFDSPDADAVNVMCAYGSGRVFVLVFRSDHHGAATGLDYWSAGSFIIPTDRLVAGWNMSANPRINDWAKWGGDDWLGYAGVARVHPKHAVLAWIGDRLALLSGGVDRQSGTSTTDWQTPSMTYLGGTTRRPLRRIQHTHFDLTTEFLTASWTSALGSLNGGPMTSSFNPFSSSSAGSPTITWTPEAMQISMTPSDRRNWMITTALAGLTTARLADDGVLGFSTRAQPGTIPATPFPGTWTPTGLRNMRWGGRVQSESLLTVGLTLDLSVHIDGDGSFAVYEPSALTTLYVAPAGTLAGITSGSWYDFRLGSAHSSNLGIPGAPQLFGEVAWAKAGDFHWNSTGLLTLAGSGTATAFEIALMGHGEVPTIASVTEWREFVYRRDSALANVGFTNPGRLRGFDCLPHVHRVGAGHDILWGGAGGFKGDTYSCPVRYEYGFGQVLGDAPRSHWRSLSSVTAQAVLDSTLIRNDNNERFVHSGMAGISTNSRFIDVEYGDDVALTVPVKLRVDGKRYEAVVDSTALPASVKLASTAAWQDGELAGHYLRAQPNAVANPGILRIVGNAGEWVHVTGLSSAGTLASYGIVAGATLDVWGTLHLHAYDDWPKGVRVNTVPAGAVDGALPRYMRVTIPGAAVQGEPPEGYWQMGRLQAGLTMPINVPLAWESQKDNEDGNIDLQTMASGTRVAYEAGAPRQTWSGTSEGDVTRWRVAFRSMVRSLAQYSLKPVVLCTDDLEQNLRGMYSRFTGSTELANVAWGWNTTTNRWERMGDLKVTFEQEV